MMRSHSYRKLWRSKEDVAGAAIFADHDVTINSSIQNAAIGNQTAGPRRLRRFDRQPVQIRAVLYCGDTFQTISIRDISTGGAGIDGCNCLMQNDKVTIKLLNGRCLDAHVRWWFAGVCGVQFVKQLKEADVLLTGRFRYAGGG